MILCGLFAAVISVFSLITIPTGIIPVSFGLFGVMLSSAVLDTKTSVTAVLIYILIGAAGIPVFSGFKGGLSVLIGPTGGYITSYIFAALIISTCAGRISGGKYRQIIGTIAACLAGTAVCYAVGTAHFMLVQPSDIKTALGLCVFPFIPFDAVKTVLAAFISYHVRRLLNRHTRHF